MKLESLNSSMFAPMSATEASMIKGGIYEAPASSSTIFSNSYVNGTYIGPDKDTFTD
ncbi:MAG: hypothetical protein JWM27_4929 [Gemmatimonadetes bacterium]|jgi:hypothetical protein|nr:hypothetical protein [Gemmatimonadota bacterium]